MTNNPTFALGNYRGIYNLNTDIQNILNPLDNDWQIEQIDKFYNIWMFSDGTWTQIIPNISMVIENQDNINEELPNQTVGQMAVNPELQTIFIYNGNEWKKVNSYNQDHQINSDVQIKALNLGEKSSEDIEKLISNSQNNIMNVTSGQNMFKGTCVSINDEDGKIYPFIQSAKSSEILYTGNFDEIESQIVNEELIINIESENDIQNYIKLSEKSYHKIKMSQIGQNLLQILYLTKNENDEYQLKLSIYQLENSQLILKYSHVINSSYSGEYELTSLSQLEGNYYRLLVSYRDDQKNYNAFLKFIKFQISASDIENFEIYNSIIINENINNMRLCHSDMSFMILYQTSSQLKYQIFLDSGERKKSDTILLNGYSEYFDIYYDNYKYYISYSTDEYLKIKLLDYDGYLIDKEKIIQNTYVKFINLIIKNEVIYITYFNPLYNSAVLKTFDVININEISNVIFSDENVTDININMLNDILYVLFIEDDTLIKKYIYNIDELKKTSFYVGILNQDQSVDESCEVSFIGGIYDSDEILISGKRYYIQEDSSISENKTEFFQGIQISNNKLFVLNNELHGNLKNIFSQADINQEQFLGYPSLNGQILISDINGNRYWANFPKIDESKIIHKDVDETVSSEKVFTVIPKTQITPTFDDDISNKKYVDTMVNSLDNDLNHLSQDEIITGKKTFSQQPYLSHELSEIIPDSDEQIISKKQQSLILEQILLNYLNMSQENTITEKQTFSIFPELPNSFPSEETQQTNKKYVDFQINENIQNKITNDKDELINGIKQFSSFPLLPNINPTEDLQIAHKKYIDEVQSQINLDVDNKQNLSHTHSPEDIESSVIYNKDGTLINSQNLKQDIYALNTIINALTLNDSEIKLIQKTNFHNTQQMQTLNDMINSLDVKFSSITNELNTKQNIQDTTETTSKLTDQINSNYSVLLEKINTNFDNITERLMNISEVANSQTSLEKFNILQNNVNEMNNSLTAMTNAFEDFISKTYSDNLQKIDTDILQQKSDVTRDIIQRLNDNIQQVKELITQNSDKIRDLAFKSDISKIITDLNGLSLNLQTLDNNQKLLAQSTDSSVQSLNENLSDLKSTIQTNISNISQSKADMQTIDSLKEIITSQKETSDSQINSLIENKLDTDVYRSFKEQTYNVFNERTEARLSNIEANISSLKTSSSGGDVSQDLIEEIQSKVNLQQLPAYVSSILDAKNPATNETIPRVESAKFGSVSLNSLSQYVNGNYETIIAPNTQIVQNSSANDYQECFVMSEKINKNNDKLELVPFCMDENTDTVKLVENDDDLMNIVGISSNQFGMLLNGNVSDCYVTKIPIQMTGTLYIPKSYFSGNLKIGNHITWDIKNKKYTQNSVQNIPYYLNLGKIIYIDENLIKILIRG